MIEAMEIDQSRKQTDLPISLKKIVESSQHGKHGMWLSLDDQSPDVLAFTVQTLGVYRSSRKFCALYIFFLSFYTVQEIHGCKKTKKVPDLNGQASADVSVPKSHKVARSSCITGRGLPASLWETRNGIMWLLMKPGVLRQRDDITQKSGKFGLKVQSFCLQTTVMSPA